MFTEYGSPLAYTYHFVCQSNSLDTPFERPNKKINEIDRERERFRAKPI